MIPMPTWTPEVWTLLGPLIALCLGGCVMMALDLVPAAKRWPIGWLALVPLAAAAWMLSRLWEAPLAGAQQLLGGALRVDGLAIFTSCGPPPAWKRTKEPFPSKPWLSPASWVTP